MSFVFTSDNLKKIDEILSHYPKERKASGLIPILDLAQRQNNGWLSPEAIIAVSKMLDIPEIRIYEVATFYTMFNLKPVGKYHIKVCGTTPCWLCGAADIRQACEKHLEIGLNETTRDQMFTLSEFECLGACVNAPVVQINDEYIEDVDSQGFIDLLDRLKQGESLKPHSMQNRQASKPKL